MGYVGEVNDYLMTLHPEYDLGDYLGISGIEASYETELRGIAGKRYITVDNRNRDVGSFAEGRYDEQPAMGAELQLTLDAELQALAEELMRGKRGSIVAIEPSTGEILALVSSPAYDPNDTAAMPNRAKCRWPTSWPTSKPVCLLDCLGHAFGHGPCR